MKSREYLLKKLRAQNRYNHYGNYSGTNTGANSRWHRPRDDMDKRKSCANCGSMDHHVLACSTYKQKLKAIDYFLNDAAQTALQNVQQELATKEIEQWERSELENTELREKLDTLLRTTKEEDNQEPSNQGLELHIISRKTFGMTREGMKIMSIISVAGHQVVKNLSEPSEITAVHLDIYADYLRQERPQTGL